MRIHTLGLCALVLALTLPGCGGRSGGPIPPGVKRDSGVVKRDWRVPIDVRLTKKDGPKPPPDWRPDRPIFPPDRPQPGCRQQGETCGATGSCCGNLPCVNLPTGVQVCAEKCQPDQLQTPLVNEDTCPGAGKDFLCSRISGTGGPTHCLKICEPTTGKNTCSAGLSCSPRSVALTVNYDKAVCAYPACKTDQDCPVLLNRPCSPPGTTTANCTAMSKLAFCAENPYQSGTAGLCALPGKCDTKSGLCLGHTWGKATARVGDPCIDDRQCGPNMRCRNELNAGTDSYPNGYCAVEGCAFAKTLTHRACPAGSTCGRYYAGGLCLKVCDLKTAKQCRGYAKDRHGDYECRAWNNLQISGGMAASSPVCEPGASVPCTLFGGSSLDCSAFGLQGNPTNMSCRDRAKGTKLSPNDPQGLCLDDTASGAKY